MDINEHRGYVAGLDPNMVVDGELLYYSDPMVEMVFHDVTMLKSDPSDPKQLKKVFHS
jgi:hypothetical protein